ncbi:MAG: AAA family ATPase [Deltaproteobacteria bacterium]|jgi:non-specific protein-tyrosine kinase|nr:AAA family ATPase [Deltaproteobacteria bacterium]MDL1987615.1 AAA family ATPase [Deltaproteobacteria bacterium]
MSEIKKALEKARKEGKIPLKEALVEDSPKDRAEQLPSPAYSQTRSVQVDLKKLIDRKVFSILKKDEVADQYKFLMTRILNKTRPNGYNTIEIASFKEGEGKSLTSVNLAITLAKESRQTVLLVDMDLRRPSIHRILGIDLAPGLKDYFLNGTPIKEILIHPGIERLTVLPAGGRMDNSTEIMDSHRMEALILEIKTRYKDRYIIFDAPALNTCSDPLILASYVDTIALVARAGYTTTEDITSGMALLKDKNILGIILNDSGIRRGWTY